MEPTPNNASAKIISALIIGLIVGFVAGAFWQERRLNSLPDGNSSAARIEGGGQTKQTASAASGVVDTVKTAPVDMTKVGSGKEPTLVMESAPSSLKVEDQVAGAAVQIANISAREIIWVAVREEKDGKVGNILGAQKVFVGDNQKATVDLLRPTVAGGAYRVVVYRDTGSPAFNYREDVLVTGVEGRFTAK